MSNILKQGRPEVVVVRGGCTVGRWRLRRNVHIVGEGRKPCKMMRVATEQPNRLGQ